MAARALPEAAKVVAKARPDQMVAAQQAASGNQARARRWRQLDEVGLPPLAFKTTGASSPQKGHERKRLAPREIVDSKR